MFILRSKRHFVINYMITNGLVNSRDLDILLKGLLSVPDERGAMLVSYVVFNKDVLQHIKKGG